MTRTITTAAELDALPWGAVIERTLLGEHADDWHKRRDGRWLSEDGDVWTVDLLAAQALNTYCTLALLDAPAPAPSVVPEAAVPNDAAVDAVAIRLYLADRDSSARGAWSALGDGQKCPYRAFACDLLTAALPLLTAAPSATRDEVARALVPTLDEWWCGDHVDYHATDDEGGALPCCVAERQRQAQRQADALLARFNITPKEDR